MIPLDEKPLDAQTADTCWKIYNEISFVNICKKILLNNLLRNGLGITTKNATRDSLKKESSYIQEVINKHWIGLAADIIAYVLTIGVVPVRIVHDKQKGLKVPQVVPWTDGNSCSLRITFLQPSS